MQTLLYITTNLNTSGGVARVLSLKLNYLAKSNDYNIHVINTHATSTEWFYEFDKAITIHELQPKGSSFLKVFRYARNLQNKINEINPNIIINCDNGLKGALFPYLYKGDVPLIFENHSDTSVREVHFFQNLKARLKDYIFFKSIKRYQKIVSVHNSKPSFDSSRNTVIYNPLSFELPERSSALNTKIVLAVGRISYEKGYDKMLIIWSLFINHHPDWQLHIYGQGDSSSLKRQAAALKISNTVLFFEPTLQIKDVYLNASILINTSRYESFGMALIEAMACGLPVLAFENTAGPKIYIKNKVNGFLIQTNDLSAYANQMRSLIEDKEQMKKIGKRAKQSVNSFDLALIMKQWHQLFRSVAASVSKKQM